MTRKCFLLRTSESRIVAGVWWVIFFFWLPTLMLLLSFCCVTHLYFLFFVRQAPSSSSFPKGKGAVLLYYAKLYFFHFNNRIYRNKQRTLPPKFLRRGGDRGPTFILFSSRSTLPSNKASHKYLWTLPKIDSSMPRAYVSC